MKGSILQMRTSFFGRLTIRPVPSQFEIQRGLMQQQNEKRSLTVYLRDREAVAGFITEMQLLWDSIHNPYSHFHDVLVSCGYLVGPNEQLLRGRLDVFCEASTPELELGYVTIGIQDKVSGEWLDAGRLRDVFSCTLAPLLLGKFRFSLGKEQALQAHTPDWSEAC